ncbi:DNA recombination protein RmuC [Parasphingorhabdus marina DSM 22363]|uniref:DNA recombination protein RmuC homolog n=1 Tax=Parasphingorhabdus marina DSM 22363 TaxID=1123272 RepID=A0A1N6F8L2_9SPHN|nr:DNA recombination protein RmuC [Parasphingorhabdus marina]SIN91638.1 DNA recombination protein RmuC [Parasphingorhabdus marina DSM 22363]
MDPVFALVLAIATLVLGLGAGWFFGQKSIGSAVKAAEDTTDSLRSMLDGVTRERDGAREERDHIREDRDQARQRLASLEADARNHEKQLQQLIEAKESLSAQFSEVGAKMLETAQRQFLERADQRFDQASEKGGEKIAKLLQPVNERLSAYEESVRKIEKERTESYAGITATIEQVRQGQDRVQQEAARLVNSLRNAPKSRGRWGEQQLKNVLETCGLSEHTDFVTEQSIDTDEGRLRPDAVISVPGGRKLVIDAKVSLNDYQDAFEAEDDDARSFAMARHCNSMKVHIDGLSKKAYWDQFEDAPDYVIMFVPGEHFLSAALEHEPALWDHAFEKKVLLATPTNLVAIARTVAGVWRQEKMAAEAKQIGQLGKEMYDRLAVAGEHLKRMGSGLGSAVGNYNKFVGSFERNVMATGRKFAALNVETGKKELDRVEEIEALPRYAEDVQSSLIEDASAYKDEAAE